VFLTVFDVPVPYRQETRLIHYGMEHEGMLPVINGLHPTGLLPVYAFFLRYLCGLACADTPCAGDKPAGKGLRTACIWGGGFFRVACLLCVGPAVHAGVCRHGRLPFWGGLAPLSYCLFTTNAPVPDACMTSSRG